jgi:hypothetical protein
MPFLATRAALLTLVLGLLPARALAETDRKTEARQHFDRGAALAQQKDYDGAVTELKRAYELDPDSAVLFDLGQAHAAAGQPVQAVDALGRYLTDGNAQISDERRRQIEAEIVQQEARIATVTVKADLSGVVIRVDGSEIGRTPLAAPIRLGAGVHSLDASIAGYLPYEQKLELSGGESRAVEFAFRQQASQAGSLVSPPAGGPALSRNTLAYVVGASGVAALAVGAAFGFQAISRRHDSDRECPQNQCTERGVDLNNQAKRAALVADITIGAGLVAVGVATYLLLRPAAGTAPPGALAFGHVHLSSELVPGGAGLRIGGSW